MRLVASDIDGTILGHDGKISGRTVRAFHACRDAGVELVFVTGRPPRWLHPLQDQLGHAGTVICSNGAVVWDLETEQLVSARTLAIESVLEVRRIIKQLRPAALFAAETLTGFHLEPGFIENESSELLSEFTPAPLAETLATDDSVVKFLAIVREGTPDDFLAEVRPAVGHLAAVTHSSPGGTDAGAVPSGRQQGRDAGRIRVLTGYRRRRCCGLRGYAERYRDAPLGRPRLCDGQRPPGGHPRRGPAGAAF
ncbi:hydroxymethylpyrimidine pyrophosphatase-like HAD family hydrolase [Pseudarthrobacter sp. SLBN-100]